MTISKFKKQQYGFTLIELLVVVAIIGLLSSIVMSSLNTARSKARFAQVIEIMHSMEQATMFDYSDSGNYAADVGSGTAPSFVPKYLPNWPTPPCANWTYDYENWGSVIQISLRRVDSAIVYFYCINTSGSGNCNDGGGTNIKTASSKTLTCSE